MTIDLTDMPQRDWGKKLEKEWEQSINGTVETLRIFSVEPQAHLIGVTKPVGLLEGLPMDAILVKAFEKNYKTPAKPKVVEVYGFERQHAEPVELVGFQYECIYDRACEAEMNRYRHNSKNYESGRYVDYIKHGLTIVFPEDCVTDQERKDFIEDVVVDDLIAYARIVRSGGKKQAARRRLGFYVAVESVFSINLRSLWHMARQRSAKYSPNGKEAEPQISTVVTMMVDEATPHLPVFKDVLMKMIGAGYR